VSTPKVCPADQTTCAAHVCNRDGAHFCQLLHGGGYQPRGPSPTLSPGTRGAAPQFKHFLFGAILLASIALWTVPDLAAWLHRWLPAPLQTSVQAACRIPSEFEQLHIIVRERDGRFVAECMYVGPRGAYSQERRQ
jgi:hypothetical protein